MTGVAEVLIDRSLDATCAERRGSTAVNPRLRSGERRKRDGRRRVVVVREVVEEEEEEEAPVRREREVGEAAADAIVRGELN